MISTTHLLSSFSILSILPILSLILPTHSLPPPPPSLLILPSLNITNFLPLNLTTLSPSARPPHYPSPPFTLPIPTFHPPQSLLFTSLGRPGWTREKYALLDEIHNQIECTSPFLSPADPLVALPYVSHSPYISRNPCPPPPSRRKVEKETILTSPPPTDYTHHPTPAPLPFTHTLAYLIFTLTLPPPSPDLSAPPLLTTSLAIAALDLFYAMVDAYGARECDFRVVDGEEGEGGGMWRGRFGVRWRDDDV